MICIWRSKGHLGSFRPFDRFLMKQAHIDSISWANMKSIWTHLSKKFVHISIRRQSCGMIHAFYTSWTKSVNVYINENHNWCSNSLVVGKEAVHWDEVGHFKLPLIFESIIFSRKRPDKLFACQAQFCFCQNLLLNNVKCSSYGLVKLNSNWTLHFCD